MWAFKEFPEYLLYVLLKMAGIYIPYPLWKCFKSIEELSSGKHAGVWITVTYAG